MQQAHDLVVRQECSMQALHIHERSEIAAQLYQARERLSYQELETNVANLRNENAKEFYENAIEAHENLLKSEQLKCEALMSQPSLMLTDANAEMIMANTSQDLMNALDRCRTLENKAKVEEQLIADLRTHLDRSLQEKVKIGHDHEITKQELAQERAKRSNQESTSPLAPGSVRPSTTDQVLKSELDAAVNCLHQFARVVKGVGLRTPGSGVRCPATARMGLGVSPAAGRFGDPRSVRPT